jgi:NAD(P)H-hydrate epimerase
VVVLCGKGGNGGDGLAAARHLARLGVTPRVILMATADDLGGDAALNLRAARGSGLLVEEVPDAASWSRIHHLLDRPVVVVDALLGTGVQGGARGLMAEVIRDVNRSAADVVAVDLPSGLDADSPLVPGPAIGADRTYTLCRPKVPIVLEPGALHAGRWSVIPIGIPDEAVAEARPEIEWLDADAARSLVRPRPDQSHKGIYGHLLAVAGSTGKSGAAVLVARGALRAGAGLVTVATPSSVLPVVAAQQAEVMTAPLPEAAPGDLGPGATERLLALLEERDALAMGPGLGTSAGTRDAVIGVIAGCRVPAVLDADALNAIAAENSAGPPRHLGSTWPRVLTPHPGEAARLLSISTASVQEDRLDAVRRLASSTGAWVVLKGHRTLVAGPGGRVSINSTGNPGMATGGMGDVLTGMIGALLARGMEPPDAARLAVFAHGDAGDRAAAARGQEGLTASDLLEALPATFRELACPGEPAPW